MTYQPHPPLPPLYSFLLDHTSSSRPPARARGLGRSGGKSGMDLSTVSRGSVYGEYDNENTLCLSRVVVVVVRSLMWQTLSKRGCSAKAGGAS